MLTCAGRCAHFCSDKFFSAWEASDDPWEVCKILRCRKNLAFCSTLLTLGKQVIRENAPDCPFVIGTSDNVPLPSAYAPMSADIAENLLAQPQEVRASTPFHTTRDAPHTTTGIRPIVENPTPAPTLVIVSIARRELPSHREQFTIHANGATTSCRPRSRSPRRDRRRRAAGHRRTARTRGWAGLAAAGGPHRIFRSAQAGPRRQPARPGPPELPEYRARATRPDGLGWTDPARLTRRRSGRASTWASF